MKTILGGLRRVSMTLVFVTGLILVAAFITRTHLYTGLIAACVTSFVVGGVSLVTANRERTPVRIETAAVVAYAMALGFGPITGAGPAAAAALGALVFNIDHRSGLRVPIYRIGCLTALSSLSSFVFIKLGGNLRSGFTADSILPIAASAVTFVVMVWLLSTARKHIKDLVALGACSVMAALFVAAMPWQCMILAMVPAGLVLSSRNRVESEEEIEDSLIIDEVEVDDENRSSMIDPITGLANQRYLEMFLQQEMTRAERFKQTISILLIDIDNFAAVNLNHGTDEADRCLSAIGAGIKQMLREYDLAARFKHDEFVVVLPETGETGATNTARRLHAALSGRVLPVRAKFSVGVATYPSHGATVDDILSSAHHALNRAKFSGKNSVVSCHELAKAG